MSNKLSFPQENNLNQLTEQITNHRSKRSTPSQFRSTYDTVKYDGPDSSLSINHPDQISSGLIKTKRGRQNVPLSSSISSTNGSSSSISIHLNEDEIPSQPIKIRPSKLLLTKMDGEYTIQRHSNFKSQNISDDDNVIHQFLSKQLQPDQLVQLEQEQLQDLQFLTQKPLPSLPQISQLYEISKITNQTPLLQQQPQLQPLLQLNRNNNNLPVNFNELYINQHQYQLIEQRLKVLNSIAEKNHDQIEELRHLQQQQQKLKLQDQLDTTGEINYQDALQLSGIFETGQIPPQLYQKYSQQQQVSTNAAYLNLLLRYQSLHANHTNQHNDYIQTKQKLSKLISEFQLLQQQYHTLSVFNNRMLFAQPGILNIDDIHILNTLPIEQYELAVKQKEADIVQKLNNAIDRERIELKMNKKASVQQRTFDNDEQQDDGENENIISPNPLSMDDTTNDTTSTQSPATKKPTKRGPKPKVQPIDDENNKTINNEQDQLTSSTSTNTTNLHDKLSTPVNEAELQELIKKQPDFIPIQPFVRLLGFTDGHSLDRPQKPYQRAKITEQHLKQPTKVEPPRFKDVTNQRPVILKGRTDDPTELFSISEQGLISLQFVAQDTTNVE